MEVGNSNPMLFLSTYSQYNDTNSTENNNITNNSNNVEPLSPIRERTQKAIAQHRAWRQPGTPDVRRTYTGTTTSVTGNNNHNTKRSMMSQVTTTNTITNVEVSNMNTVRASIPMHTVADAIYEDIEQSNSNTPTKERNIVTSNNATTSTILDDDDGLLQQMEQYIIAPSLSLRSNVSSSSTSLDRPQPYTNSLYHSNNSIKGMNNDSTTSNTNTNNNRNKLNNSNNDSVNTNSMHDQPSYRREKNNANTLGIEPNRTIIDNGTSSHNNNDFNELDLLRRQQYVYESYRSLHEQNDIDVALIKMSGSGDKDIYQRQQQQQSLPIIFRDADSESVGTGMSSQQELIRKKVRSQNQQRRKKRLSNGNTNSTKSSASTLLGLRKPVLQLPVQLLIPARISTPQRLSFQQQQQQSYHPYRSIQQQQKQVDLQQDTYREKVQTNNNDSVNFSSFNMNKIGEEHLYYNDPELVSLSTTVDTTSESRDSPPAAGSFAAAIMPIPSNDHDSNIHHGRPPKISSKNNITNRDHRYQPTLAVRGDDALLWVEPIDQRSVGDDSTIQPSLINQRGFDVSENLNNNKQNVDDDIFANDFYSVSKSSPTQKQVITNMTIPSKTSVRFARSLGSSDGDDESSMPWDQKTDLTNVMNPPSSSPTNGLENINEELTPEVVTNTQVTPTAITSPTTPKSILRKPRYTTPQVGGRISSLQKEIDTVHPVQQIVDTTTDRNASDTPQLYLNPTSIKDDSKSYTRPLPNPSRDLSPPRDKCRLVNLEELELSPIQRGQESLNQSMEENSNVEDNQFISPAYGNLGHPAEKHLKDTMAKFLAMRDGEVADYVRDDERYPDPPLEIDVDDDETVLSAYVFIETVAAIVIQTAVRQFLAVLHLDSLRQTRDSMEVAQRVVQIEDACVEESMIATSRAASSTDSEKNGYSYETLIDDDLDRVALDLYDLAAIQIQSVYRGFWVRDCLDVDHYCAIEIQRIFRGQYCRNAYLRDLKRIILVQSWCRRNLAREKASDLLANAIVIQSMFRSHMARKTCRIYREKKLIENAAATSIQSRWRSFVCEAHFIRSLVDILIVQTVVRKWLARQMVSRTRKDRKTQSAKIRYTPTSQSKQNIRGQIERFEGAPKVITKDSLTSDSNDSQFKLPVATIPTQQAVVPHIHTNQDKILHRDSQPYFKASSAAKEESGSGKSQLHYSVKEVPKNTVTPSISSSSAIIVNKKNMDVTILSDTKWRTAAARCITPETKKMYTKSRVVAYPISDDEGSSCTESYKIVRNSGPSVTEKDILVDHKESITEDSALKIDSVYSSAKDSDADIPKQGTTTNLLSIWKEKEKKNGYTK